MKTIYQLMDERHAAYLAAKVRGFEGCLETSKWREANLAYVTARNALNRGQNHGQTALPATQDAA